MHRAMLQQTRLLRRAATRPLSEVPNALNDVFPVPMPRALAAASSPTARAHYGSHANAKVARHTCHRVHRMQMRTTAYLGALAPLAATCPPAGTTSLVMAQPKSSIRYSVWVSVTARMCCARMEDTGLRCICVVAVRCFGLQHRVMCCSDDSRDLSDVWSSVYGRGLDLQDVRSAQ